MIRRVTLGARSASPRATTRIGVEHVLGRCVLEQEPAGAGPDRGVHVVVDVERGQHDHPHTGQIGIGRDPPGGFDAVEHRHADVHQHHIGPMRAGQLDGLLTVGSLADELEIGGVLDHRPQAGADQRLIIDDPDPHGHVGAPNGKRAATWKPPIGPRAGIEVTVVHGDALAHPHQTLPGRRRHRGWSRASRALVVDLDGHGVVGVAHDDRRPSPAGVPDHIGERLLHDAVGGEVDAQRERRAVGPRPAPRR